jgi:hypothetical protein
MQQVCFNCRLSWNPRQLESVPAGLDITQRQFESVPAGLDIARLRIYRAAVRAGFYTDELTVER